MKPTDKTEVTRILGDLIALDTTSRNSNLRLIDYAETLLAEYARKYPGAVKVDLTRDASGEKANLFATLGGSGGEDGSGGGAHAGIVLSGHTDVVPVDGQDWATDPFAAEVIGDKLYGRGSCDMKGFLAICLAHIGGILDAKLKTPIHLAFSYDEEVGCLGVRELLADLAKREVAPRACIIGEPTSMAVIRAHKGMLYKRCRVRGCAAHSSLVHRGVNAVSVAAAVICFIEEMAERIAREGPFDESFEPPYTTLHCGVIRGGTVNNILAEECVFEFEVRNLPQQSPLPLFAEVEKYIGEKLLPKMRAVSEKTGFDWSVLADYPGMDTEIGAAVLGMAEEWVGGKAGDRGGGGGGGVSYGTEGGLFHAAGIPTAICGPGSIQQAHKPDEYIDLAQLVQGERFLKNLVASLGRD